ncbi:CinA family protein [Rathayibacter sp. KR2-224]|uniref:CinA family protein n=1 Tax=Rathayibacter sp. KR2-224 TaxID=3400913 RepID=UPI003C08B490
MSRPGELNEDAVAEAAAIARVAQRRPLKVACAESLTSGAIASHLGAAESSSQWFVGGVVAYSKQMKYDVLGVDRGPVVTASCAAQMAEGVARLTGADLTVAVTGEGGPQPSEDAPVGTVFVALHHGDKREVREFHFDGDPSTIVYATTLQSLRMLREAAER